MSALCPLSVNKGFTWLNGRRNKGPVSSWLTTVDSEELAEKVHLSRYVGLHGHGISITMNEVNIPGPGRGEFMWLQREVECLRFIKLDKHNCQHLVLDFGVF